MTAASGPLAGRRVIELAGLGPGPFAAMLLADLGADVIRVDRVIPGGLRMGEGDRLDVVNRGKRSIALDLKFAAGRDLVLDLAAGADALIEGYRPGVAERLGVGPEECAARNPKLVYGRMTGWGQEGPLAPVAGHDINYIALTGALWATGQQDQRPAFALNLLGDYAGGSMFLVMGVLAAILEAERSGQGQVVDAAMVDGASVLTTMFTALTQMGVWDTSRRGANPLDSGSPWYDTYACADGKWISVGALEPQFYATMVELTGFREGVEGRLLQPPASEWAGLRADWTALWASRSRDEWAALLGGTDACVQPVLDWHEREAHPHLAARGTFVEHGGIRQPAPAPRLSRTPLGIDGLPPLRGEHTLDIAAELGLSADDTAKLLEAGVISAAT
ncbi:MAG: carnitine dehydratase [Frankiales bacterium]|nr:carnitine dehydratase [Frankiales bacterium]